MAFTDAPMSEEALLFGKMNSLVGIITDPPEALRDERLPAIIILNCGILHRVGPHRLYVKLARQLATMGFVGLRFDFSGIGDSQVRADHLPVELSPVSETQEAMDRLSAVRRVERFILMGICSGGATSFNVACRDPRVVGAALINVPFGSDDDRVESLVVANFYWRKALFNPHNWLRVVKGQANYRNMLRVLRDSVTGAIKHRKTGPEENTVGANMRSLIERNLNLLMVYSEEDFSLSYFYAAFAERLNELRLCRNFRVEIIPRADHTFSSLWSQELILKEVCQWASTTLRS